MIVAIIAHLCINAIRCATQCQFAQRNQVALAEKILRRTLGLLGEIDLAFFQSLQQLVRGKIDQLDFIGVLQHCIRDGFPYRNAGDLRDDIVEAVDVLHVDRGIDIDACLKQFLDILPALGMARTRRIGVR